MPDIDRQAYEPKDKQVNQIPVRRTEKFVKFDHLENLNFITCLHTLAWKLSIA